MDSEDLRRLERLERKVESADGNGCCLCVVIIIAVAVYVSSVISPLRDAVKDLEGRVQKLEKAAGKP